MSRRGVHPSHLCGLSCTLLFQVSSHELTYYRDYMILYMYVIPLKVPMWVGGVIFRALKIPVWVRGQSLNVPIWVGSPCKATSKKPLK